MRDLAIFGDPVTCKALVEAARAQHLNLLNSEDLEIQDEWGTRRWFASNEPGAVFICVGLQGQNSVGNFLFTTAGCLNVIRAAVGNVARLVLVSVFPSAEFFLFKRLIELYRAEKGLDFEAMFPHNSEDLEAFTKRCVLTMTNVLAKEKDTPRSESEVEGREVRDQMVPEPKGGEQHGSAAPAVLEVPIQAAEGKTPGDVCAQQAAVACQGAPDSVLDNAGPVSRVVPSDRLPGEAGN